MNNIDNTKPERIVRMPELLRRLQVDRSTIYRWMKEDRFPSPIQLGSRSIGWKASTIELWISSREVS